MAMPDYAKMSDVELDAEVRRLIEHGDEEIPADFMPDTKATTVRGQERKEELRRQAWLKEPGGVNDQIKAIREEVQTNPARADLASQWKVEKDASDEQFRSQLRQSAALFGTAVLGAGLAGGFAGAGAGAAGGGLTATEAAATPAMSSSYVAPAIATSSTEGLIGTAGAGGILSQQTIPSTSTPSTTQNTETGWSNPNTLGSITQGITSLVAGQQGVNAAQDATEELRRQFDIGQANMAPWLQAGQTALTAQQELMGLGPNGPEAQLSSLMSSPGYQFRLGQGERSLEASSAARGGMGSGKAGTAMAQFGQDYASNEYGNRLNQLAGLSGTGQSTSNTLANLGMNYAGEIGNQSIAGANARQSGILGAGSALSNWMNPQPQQLTLADYMRSR